MVVEDMKPFSELICKTFHNLNAMAIYDRLHVRVVVLHKEIHQRS